MNRLGITTPERGLTFKIIISNEGDTPLQIDKLYINVRVDSDTHQFWKQLTIDYLYLPKNESDYRFVKVDFGGSQYIIGDYTAKLSYFVDYVSGEGTPIEVYPFDFKVMSEDGLQNAINQNPAGPTIIIYLPEITIFSSGGITVLALAIGIRRKRKG